MSVKNHRPKAKQWAFTIKFDNDTIDRLSKLPRNAAYCAYAIMEDDTGKKSIKGYIKMNSRCRTPTLIRLLGFGFFNTCFSSDYVKFILIELKSHKSFVEFGNASESATCGKRKDLESFKKGVEANLRKEELEILHPKIFLRYPAFVNKLLCCNRDSI